MDKKKFTKKEVLELFEEVAFQLYENSHIKYVFTNSPSFKAWFKENVTDVKLKPGVDYIAGPVTGVAK